MTQRSDEELLSLAPNSGRLHECSNDQHSDDGKSLKRSSPISEEELGGRQSKASKKNRQSSRSEATQGGVFDEAQITDEERRELRRQQRLLQSQLEGHHAVGKDDDQERPEDVPDEAHRVDVLRKKNNALYERVHYTREAVLDAENVDLITHMYVQQVERLIQVPSYDVNKLVNKLISKCTTSKHSETYFDWVMLGKEAVVCFNAVPDRVTFLGGVLGSDVDLIKKRKPRAPRQKNLEEEEEVEPEQVKKNGTADADQLAAVEKTMKVMKAKLKERCKEALKSDGKNATIDAIQYLFNPDSFTQTVENIFHFSFLIKRGEAEIGLNDSSGPYVRHRHSSEGLPTCTQAVASFTMRDWRRICRAYSLEKGDLPHRHGSKHERRHPSSSQQPS